MSDLEQRELAVRRAIAKYRDEPDFPKFEDYGGSDELLDDYFYAQTPQGTMEDEKRKFTIFGVLLIVPVAVMSFFFRDVMELLYGLLIGGVLSALYYLYLVVKIKMVSMIQNKLKLRYIFSYYCLMLFL